MPEDRGDELAKEQEFAQGQDQDQDHYQDDQHDVGLDEGYEDEGSYPEEGDDTSDESEGQPRDERGRFVSVPKARFDEAIAKERARAEEAERRLAEYESGRERQNVLAHYDQELNSLEEARANALLDGDTKKAAEIASAIRNIERRISSEGAGSTMEVVKAQAREEIRMELTVDRLEYAYPELNPDLKSTYDPDLVEMVLYKQKGLVESGMHPSQALAQAADSIMSRFGPRRETEDLGAARKQNAVRRNVDAQRRQPPRMSDVGMDSDKVRTSVADLSNAEFDNLPEAAKARARGDFL